MSFRIGWSGRSHDYSEQEIAAVVEAMRTGDPQTQGKYLTRFEEDFAAYVGQGTAFGVTNCTHALELAADLCRLRPGDEVVIPGHTYCASAIPFSRTGARLRWADIDPSTLLVTLDSIRRLVTPKTKAIVVVHLYGLLNPEIESIAEFARSKGIPLVEDCAQSMGARLAGKHAGTFGTYGCFSFHGQKNMTTMGEGGMLLVKDAHTAKLVPGLRHNGHAPFANQKEYWLPAMSNIDVDLDGVWPHNFSMGETTAALGSALLKRLDNLNDARRRRGEAARAELRELSELRFQSPGTPGSHAHHLLPARYDAPVEGRGRDDLIRKLSGEYGIKAIVQYYPLYRYDLFRKMGMGEADCPNTDAFFDRMVSFPFHVWMTDDDFSYMVQSVGAALLALRKG